MRFIHGVMFAWLGLAFLSPVSALGQQAEPREIVTRCLEAMGGVAEVRAGLEQLVVEIDESGSLNRMKGIVYWKAPDLMRTYYESMHMDYYFMGTECRLARHGFSIPCLKKGSVRKDGNVRMHITNIYPLLDPEARLEGLGAEVVDGVVCDFVRVNYPGLYAPMDMGFSRETGLLVITRMDLLTTNEHVRLRRDMVISKWARTDGLLLPAEALVIYSDGLEEVSWTSKARIGYKVLSLGRVDSSMLEVPPPPRDGLLSVRELPEEYLVQLRDPGGSLDEQYENTSRSVFRNDLMLHDFVQVSREGERDLVRIPCSVTLAGFGRSLVGAFSDLHGSRIQPRKASCMQVISQKIDWSRTAEVESWAREQGFEPAGEAEVWIYGSFLDPEDREGAGDQVYELCLPIR